MTCIQNVACLTADHVVIDFQRLPVYHQKLTTESYLYQDDIAELSEFTLCFWIKRNSFNLPNADYMVSIAYSGLYLLVALLD